MNMPRLGIAIVHYRAEKLLVECLRRLQSSELADFRVCLVDCGSRRRLDTLLPDDERFQLLNAGTNLGFAAASNRAFEQLGVETPFLLTLNPDVMVEPATLRRVLHELGADPELGAATCRLLLPSGKTDPACRRSEPTLLSAFSRLSGLNRLFPRSRLFGSYNLTYLDADQAHDVASASGAFLMVRTEAFQASGGKLDEAFFLYGEDLDLCLRIRRAGYRIRYTPEAIATHIKGSGKIRSARRSFYFYRAMWIYYRKWGRFRSNVAILGLLLTGLVFRGGLEVLANTVRRWAASQGGTSR